MTLGEYVPVDGLQVIDTIDLAAQHTRNILNIEMQGARFFLAFSEDFLTLQADHKAQLVKGFFLRPLLTREYTINLERDDRYEDYVIQAGLYGVHQIGHIPTDHALQDVAVLLGLRADGDALCLSTERDGKPSGSDRENISVKKQSGHQYSVAEYAWDLWLEI